MVDGKWNKFRDDVTHDGRKIDWGKWAITGNDPVFGGTGNPDTGEYPPPTCMFREAHAITPYLCANKVQHAVACAERLAWE